MNRKVLFVDDDPNILASFKRQLRKVFDLETALGGQSGLEIMQMQGPFAVVVADMKMPGMNGIEFLMKVQEISPESVRMMLTGNADQQTAVNAVNEGNIFRFLNKPCSSEILTKILEAGIEQYRLITAEKELLKNTLTGAIKVLTDILSLTNPVAFSRAIRVKRYMKDISIALNLRDKWQFELSALLSQIGCVTVPSEILNKVAVHDILSPEEEKVYQTHPSVGCDLISQIPRMHEIAEIIKGQLPEFDETVEQSEINSSIILGRRFLQASLFFDELILSGRSSRRMKTLWQEKEEDFGSPVIRALEKYIDEQQALDIRSIRFDKLRIGMVSQEPIISKDGIHLLESGQEITYPVIVKIRNFAIQNNLKEPFKVLVTSEKASSIGY